MNFRWPGIVSLALYFLAVPPLSALAAPRKLEIYSEDGNFVFLRSAEGVRIELNVVPQMQVLSRTHQELGHPLPSGSPKTFGLDVKMYGANTLLTVAAKGITEKDKATARLMTYQEFDHPTAPFRRWVRTVPLELTCHAGYYGRDGACFVDTQDHLVSFHFDHSGYTERPSRMRYTHAVAVQLNDQWLVDPVSSSHDFRFDLDLRSKFATLFTELFKFEIR